MPEEIYKISRAIVIPLAITLFALSLLLVIAYTSPPLPGERLMLSLVFTASCYLFLEVFSRQVYVRQDGLKIKKFLREKDLAWEEITHLGCVVIGKKAYALLTPTKGFHILSNNYERFFDLLDRLIKRLGEERVDGEVRHLTGHPLKNSRPVRSIWLILIVIIVVSVLRLFVY